MSKYKCISNKYLYSQGSLTIGKIYDIFEQDILVVGLPYRKVFYVTNNDNIQMYFSPRINDSNYIGTWFKDVAEIRNNTINQILKKKNNKTKKYEKINSLCSKFITTILFN